MRTALKPRGRFGRGAAALVEEGRFDDIDVEDSSDGHGAVQGLNIDITPPRRTVTW